MVLFPSLILQNSGFLLQFRMRGTRIASRLPYNPQNPCHHATMLGFYMCHSPDALRNHLSERPYPAGHIYDPSSSSHGPWRRSHVIRAFTHLHMFLRRTVLESLTRDLPHRDQNRLLVISIAITTSLVQSPVQFMSDSVTPMRTGLAHLPSVR